jgi:hypothetical protein
LEERSNGKGNLAVASEEGQGPRRAVEPMMRMMMLSINVQLSLHINVINIGLKSNFSDNILLQPQTRAKLLILFLGAILK